MWLEVASVDQSSQGSRETYDRPELKNDLRNASPRQMLTWGSAEHQKHKIEGKGGCKSKFDLGGLD